MSMWTTKANDKHGGDFGELPSADNHVALIAAIIDLGTHEEEYQGEKYKTRKLYIVWELPNEKQPSGEPKTIAKDYNYNQEGLGKKSNLRKMMEAIRGKAYTEDEVIDISKMLGAACMVQIVHKKSAKGSEYAKIENVAGMPKGLPKPKATNLPFCYEIGNRNSIPELPWIPFLYGEKIKDIITRSEEWKAYDAKPAPATAANGQAMQPVGASVGAKLDEAPF